MVLSRNGVLNGNSFDWSDALIDASITAGITFFTSIAGVSLLAPTISILDKLLAGAIASAGQFFIFLGMKRGLVKKTGE